MQYTRKYGVDKVRVLTLVKNRGKGGAVQMVRPKMSNYSMCECSNKKKATVWKLSFFVFFSVTLKGNYELQGKSHSNGRC